MWSDRAKSIMRHSAIQAGLISPDDHHDRLMLISEPEAAALYCERKCEQYRLKHGDRFMICDCGGGTVDLIVFEIEESDPLPEPPSDNARGPIEIAPARNRKLKEVTRGHGQSCGSVFLDKNMKELLRSKFKLHTQVVPESALSSMMDEFIDLIKPNFDGVDEQVGKNGILKEEYENEMMEEWRVWKCYKMGEWWKFGIFFGIRLVKLKLASTSTLSPSRMDGDDSPTLTYLLVPQTSRYSWHGRFDQRGHRT